ncbi:helix-turn-helix domain-containing protein [Enterococcus hirae]|nr:helix-turn-helix domain-containing protein [Enterococcus hirae]
MFLNKYIEDTVLRQVSVINIVYNKECISIKSLAESQNVSPATIISDIKYIQTTLSENNDPVRLTKYFDILFFNITLTKTDIERVKKYLFSQSNFLKILMYYLQNKNKKDKYIQDKFFISKSKYYNERKKIIMFLQEINLTLNRNQIIGDFFKVIWLKASLDYFYCMGIIDVNNEEINQFLKRLNDIDECYYTPEQKELLLRLIVLFTEQDSNFFKNIALDKMIGFFEMPRNIEDEVETLINSLQQHISIEKYRIKECLLVCLFLLNNHMLSPKVNYNYKKTLSRIIVQNSYVKDLIKRLETSLYINILQDEIILYSLYSQFKLYKVKEYAFFTSSYDTDNVYDFHYREQDIVKEVFISWNNENKLELNIDFFNLKKITHDIIEYKKIGNKQRIFICSESWELYLYTYTRLKKCLRLNIELVNLWVTEDVVDNQFTKDIIIKVGEINSVRKPNEVYINNVYCNKLNWDNLNNIILEYLLI